jgi:hypothetical protein
MMAGPQHGQVETVPEELVEPIDEQGFFRSADEREEAIEGLGSWLREELDRAKAARGQLERQWEENLRQYEGVAKRRTKNVPIENASNLEITLGAIAADAIYAQMLNLIFNVNPMVTIREVGEEGRLTKHVKGLQRFVDVVTKKMGLRSAVENMLLDDIQLGTGILYTRWAKTRKKTVVDEVLRQGPMARAVPIEDFFVPGGSYTDLQQERWVGMRQWLTRHQLNLRERDLGWDIDGVQPTGNVDRVRQVRERIGRTNGFAHRKAGTDPAGGEMYEIFDVYCLYDIDRDGIDEDLLVTFDFQTKKVMKIMYNPYERRPFEGARYQLRGFIFYGLSVLEMLRPFQEGASNLYNHWVDNSLLANSRFWVGRHGAVPNNQLRIWPNRFLPVQEPERDIKAVSMADTFPSAPAALQQTVSFAEKRVGINDLTAPRPSAVLGSRTPGITALSMLQKANERFGPAFDGARLAISASVKQALYRYQERLLAGDTLVVEEIEAMLGEEMGTLVVELLADKRFDDTIAVELTASSASVNKETERQNWLLLFQQVVGLGEKIISLTQLIESQQVGPVTKNTAQQLIGIANELLDRTLRTFDQVRDPGVMLINLQQAMDAADQQQPEDQLGQLAQALQQQGFAAGAGEAEEGMGGQLAAALGGGIG